jgi:hypothetical protein
MPKAIYTNPGDIRFTQKTQIPAVLRQKLCYLLVRPGKAGNEKQESGSC